MQKEVLVELMYLERTSGQAEDEVPGEIPEGRSARSLCLGPLRLPGRHPEVYASPTSPHNLSPGSPGPCFTPGLLTLG